MVRITSVPFDITPFVAPWIDAIFDQVPRLELFDAHTHIGENDPDGMKQSPEELIELLKLAHARGAFVFPMHEPDGYPNPNDRVLEAAAASGGLLVPFCRVNPHTDDVLQEAARCLDAGARGIKLHPRAEEFTLDHPAVAQLVALAHERSLPVLIHAGRGIPALGLHAVELAGEYPEARIILAHAGICDLSWIWRAAPDHPNLLFDTAWWTPADLLALFALVPPGQILFASDAPYGRTPLSAAFQIRLALQAGLSAEQIRSIGSEQSLRLAAGEPLRSAGPPVGEREQAPHLLLDRVGEFLLLATISTMRGSPEAGLELLALARLACDVPDEIDDAPVFAAIRGLIDLFDELNAAAAQPHDRSRLGPLIMASALARTPDVPLPSSDSVPRSAAARSA